MFSQARFPPGGNYGQGWKPFSSYNIRIKRSLFLNGKWRFLKCFVSDTLQYQRTSGFEESSGFDVSAELEAGMEYSGKAKEGFELMFQMEESVTASMRLKLAGGFKHDWKTTGSRQVTDTYKSTEGENCLWQFVYGIKAWKWDTGFQTSKKAFLSDHMARTAGEFQPPKCLPGGAFDLPKYQKCAEGYEL